MGLILELIHFYINNFIYIYFIFFMFKNSVLFYFDIFKNKQFIICRFKKKKT